jgi:nitrogen regulatory protein PII
MVNVVEVRAIVRREMLDRVVHALKDAGVPRLTVTRVHTIGAGVDPATVKMAFEEGIVSAHPVLDVANIRTGRHGLDALP